MTKKSKTNFIGFALMALVIATLAGSFMGLWTIAEAGAFVSLCVGAFASIGFFHSADKSKGGISNES